MRKLWTIPEFAVVAVCWVFGDGHSLGVGDSLPEWFKVTLVLTGWVVLIDGIRVLRGGRSYMPILLMILGGLLALVLCAGGLYWAYVFISLKGLVALGSLAVIVALSSIARDVRAIRRSREG
jgi:hypothetical protein